MRYLRNKARVFVVVEGGYSATTTRTSTLFLFYHDNKISLYRSKNEVGQSVTSFLNLMHILGRRLVFFLKRNRFNFIRVILDASVCTIYL